MPFEKGNPGGPGRPRGARSKVNLLLDQIAADNIEEILAKVMEAAREGDRKAQDIVLKRLWAVPRGRPVEVDLPPIDQPADLIQAHSVVVEAMAARDITAEEAASVASVLEGQRRAFELLDQQERLEQLEDQVRRLRQNLQ